MSVRYFITEIIVEYIHVVYIKEAKKPYKAVWLSVGYAHERLTTVFAFIGKSGGQNSIKLCTSWMMYPGERWDPLRFSFTSFYDSALLHNVITKESQMFDRLNSWISTTMVK